MGGTTYRPEIDGIRAIAVLAVVLYHADAGLVPGGYVGVDVFFVVSGYLITSLLSAEMAANGRIDLVAFYARRVRRLLPALLLVIVATIALGAWLLPSLDVNLRRLVESGAASSLFVGNLYFLSHSGGYFEALDELPLLHLWSLGVEEQFYLLHPLLLMATLGLSRERAVRLVALLCVLSLLAADFLLQTAPEQAFFQMPTRFWEMGAGALVALAAPRQLPRVWSDAAIGAGLVLLGCTLWWQPPGPAFPAFGALPAVLAATSVVWGVSTRRPEDRVPLLASAPMVGIGLISYSLYLWHWPLLAIDRALSFEPSPLHLRLGLCVLAAVLAWLSWRWIELPVRRARHPDGRSLAIGIAACAVTAVAALSLPHVMPRPDAVRLADAAAADRPNDMNRCHFSRRETIVALHGDECGSAPGRAVTIAIWGDSHALAWKPFAAELADRSGGSAVSFTLDACPPIEGFSGEDPMWPDHVRNCRRMNEMALRRLQAGGFDTVVLAARWTGYLRAPSSPEVTDEDPVLAGLEETIRGLGTHVRQIIVIAPTPELRRSAPLCIASGRLPQCDIPRAEYEAAARPAQRMLAALARRHPQVRVLDPGEYFCDGVVCPAVRHGLVLFWDDDHVSSSAARAYARSLLARQPELVPPQRP